MPEIFPAILLDGALGILLLCMAWGALHAPQAYTRVALFVSFGLVLALVWARLGAPDLALAEAAIGAGLTGVLLLQTVQKLPERPADAAAPGRPAIAMICLVTVVALLTIITTRGPGSVLDPLLMPSLPDQVAARIDLTGVTHPVTAVLLNFRAWDTLLELLVLMLALLGVRQTFPGEPQQQTHSGLPPWTVLAVWARVLAPLLVLVAGYVLWRGSASPGGAFQAGAVLAAAAIVLRLTDQMPPLRWSQWPVRLTIILGAGLFTTVAGVTAWLGDGWLAYPRGQLSTIIIVSIELAATLSIAATLALLVVGERNDFRR